jgi:hypothetical protein
MLFHLLVNRQENIKMIPWTQVISALAFFVLKTFENISLEINSF